MTSTYCLKGIDQKKEFCSGSGEDWKIIVYKSMASPLLKDKKTTAHYFKLWIYECQTLTLFKRNYLHYVNILQTYIIKLYFCLSQQGCVLHHLSFLINIFQSIGHRDRCALTLQDIRTEKCFLDTRTNPVMGRKKNFTHVVFSWVSVEQCWTAICSWCRFRL